MAFPVALIHSRRVYRGNNATSTTWSHKVPSLNNGALFVEVFARNCGTVTPPTWNGTALTLVPGSEIAAGTGTARRYSAWFYMLAPTAGTANLVLAVASADSGNYGCKVFNCYNVNQTTPLQSQGGGNYALTDSGTALTSTSLSPASSVGDLVLSALYSGSAPTAGSGQYKEASAGLSNRAWTMSKEAEASSTTLSATMSSNTVVHSAIAIIGDATTQPAPADYTGSRGKKSWIAAGNLSGESLGAGSTLYCALSPSVETSGTSSDNRTIMRAAGTVSVPGARVSTNATTADSTYTLQLNGTDTGVTITIPAGTTGLFTGSGSATYASGDELGWKLVTGAGGAVTLVMLELVNEDAASQTITLLAAHSSSAGKLTPGETRYVNAYGSRASTAANTDERKAILPVMIAAAWSGLSITKVGTTTNGAVTAESRINYAAGAQALAWPTGGSEGTQEDTTHTDTLADGDVITGRMVSAGSSGDFEFERFLGRLLNTNGEFMFGAMSAAGNGQPLGAAGTQYISLCGELGLSATESATQLVARFDMAIKRLWLLTGENNSLATGDSTAVLRINGTDTAMAVSFQSGGEQYWVADFETVVNVDAGDLISIAVTHGTGGTSNTLRVRGVGFVGIERSSVVSGGSAATVSMTGTAAGAVTISGASAGAVNLFPASTGSALVSGASAASVVLTGAGAGVTGDLPISGASAQVFSLSASGAGQILVRGLSASTFSLIPQSTGSAGSSPVAGDSAAVFLLTGAGAGTIDESVGVITASPSQSRRSGRHINRPGRQTF